MCSAIQKRRTEVIWMETDDKMYAKNKMERKEAVGAEAKQEQNGETNPITRIWCVHHFLALVISLKGRRRLMMYNNEVPGGKDLHKNLTAR